MCSLHCLLQLFPDNRNGPRASQMFLTRSLSPGAPTRCSSRFFNFQQRNVYTRWRALDIFIFIEFFQKIKNFPNELKRLVKVQSRKGTKSKKKKGKKCHENSRNSKLSNLYRTKLFEYLSKHSLLKHRTTTARGEGFSSGFEMAGAIKRHLAGRLREANRGCDENRVRDRCRPE